jgi:hypothetical protein
MNYDIKQIEPMKENTREELDRYLADVSGVVRDTTIKNPNKLTNRLLKESYGDKASSVFHFVPVTMDAQSVLKILETRDMFQYFGFFKEGKYYTNMRELLMWGASVDEAIVNVDFTHYKAFTALVPNFVYAQIRTHTQVNFLQQSNRYVSVDYGYFMPDEVDMSQVEWVGVVDYSNPLGLVNFMKKSGVKRTEIFNRGKDSLQIRPFSIGLNTLNPHSAEHFFNQRAKDLHTQEETREFATALMQEVY